MFLSAKALILIITMYSLSIMLLVGQWAIADVFGITLTDVYGNPLKGTALAVVNVGNINNFQGNVTNTNPATLIVNVISTNATMLWQLFQLASGTLIFNVLFYLGVPAIMVVGLTLIYFIFVMILVVSAVYRVTV